jgi:hypothetical protein
MGPSVHQALQQEPMELSVGCADHRLACAYPLLQLPVPFDIESIPAAFPTTYQDSMNTVLVQEAIRYNTLLAVLDSSLWATLKAQEGIVVMSPDLEKVANSLYDNQVQGQGRRTTCADIRTDAEAAVLATNAHSKWLELGGPWQ